MILTDHKILLENWNPWQRSGSWRIIFSAPTLSASPSFQKLWEGKQTLQPLRRRDRARTGDGGQEVIFVRGGGLTRYADVLHLFLIDPNEKPTTVCSYPVAKIAVQQEDKCKKWTETHIFALRLSGRTGSNNASFRSDHFINVASCGFVWHYKWVK